VRVVPKPLDDRRDDVRSHAARNLRFIREALESAGSFTAVPGRGQVAIGATAVVAAFLAFRLTSRTAWLTAWLAEAVLACAIGGAAIAAKARRSQRR